MARPAPLRQLSSAGRRVLERMDAFLSETDERGCVPSMEKFAVVSVAGGETVPIVAMRRRFKAK
jgi:hypothetical protein